MFAHTKKVGVLDLDACTTVHVNASHEDARSAIRLHSTPYLAIRLAQQVYAVTAGRRSSPFLPINRTRERFFSCRASSAWQLRPGAHQNMVQTVDHTQLALGEQGLLSCVV